MIIGANGLTSLPAGIFNNLPGLTTLYVDHEAISSLPPGIFDNVTRLTYLNLNNNRLQTLPDDLFERLTALQALVFHGNPGYSFVPTAVAGDNQAVRAGRGGDARRHRQRRRLGHERHLRLDPDQRARR